MQNNAHTKPSKSKAKHTQTLNIQIKARKHANTNNSHTKPQTTQHHQTHKSIKNKAK